MLDRLMLLLHRLAGPPGMLPVRRSNAPRRRAPDRQRSRLYRWEAEAIFPADREELPLEACRALVLRAYQWAEGELSSAPGWKPPDVTDGRGRRHAIGSRAVIKLPRWARTRPVILHECAHGLAPDRHGPRFVAVYLALIEAHIGLDATALRTSAEAAGLLVGTVRRGEHGEILSKGRRAPTQRRTS